MTFKTLIRQLNNDMRGERSRLKDIRYADAKTRTIGRIQGLKRAIRLAERMAKERIAV